MSSGREIDWTSRSQPPEAQTSNGHSHRSDHPPQATPRWGLRIILIVVAPLLLLAADATYTALSLSSNLRAAESSLEEGVEALERADLASAQRSFSVALDKTDASKSLTRHPSFGLARLLPLVGPDARVVGALTDASHLAAIAGSEAVKGLDAMGVSQDGIAASVYSDGQVNFEALANAQPSVIKVEELLADAMAIVERADPARTARLNEALTRATTELGQGRDSAARGVTLMDSLPSLLAEGSTKRYLLTFQSLSEARGTGGVAGLYGVLSATDGRLELEEIAPYSKLGKVRATEAPAWFKKRYGPFKSLTQWPQANLSPVFPVVADVQLQMYESSTGESLDGVLSLDPVALAELTKATGPLHGEGLDVAVGPENAVDVILRDSYLEFEDSEKQNRFLATLVRDFWTKINEGDLDPAKFAAALGESSRGRHLTAFANDPANQVALEELKVDGGFENQGSNIQMVFNNNVSVNKVDYYLRRTIDTTIQLEADGDAHVTTNITLRNTSPSAPPSLLLGPGIKGDAPGLNRMYLNVLMPQSTRLRSFAIDGQRVGPLQDRELTYPTVWDVLEIAPGRTQVVELSYALVDAFDPSRPSDFSFHFLPQPMVTPDQLLVRIVKPEGFILEGNSDFQGLLRAPQELQVTLDRA